LEPFVAATLNVKAPEPFADPPAELVPLIEMAAFASAVPVIWSAVVPELST
jgi:hypothetical protein